VLHPSGQRINRSTHPRVAQTYFFPAIGFALARLIWRTDGTG
jgi:hypothetical protein